MLARGTPPYPAGYAYAYLSTIRRLHSVAVTCMLPSATEGENGNSGIRPENRLTAGLILRPASRSLVAPTPASMAGAQHDVHAGKANLRGQAREVRRVNTTLQQDAVQGEEHVALGGESSEERGCGEELSK